MAAAMAAAMAATVVVCVVGLASLATKNDDSTAMVDTSVCCIGSHPVVALEAVVAEAVVVKCSPSQTTTRNRRATAAARAFGGIKAATERKAAIARSDSETDGEFTNIDTVYKMH